MMEHPYMIKRPTKTNRQMKPPHSWTKQQETLHRLRRVKCEHKKTRKQRRSDIRVVFAEVLGHVILDEGSCRPPSVVPLANRRLMILTLGYGVINPYTCRGEGLIVYESISLIHPT